jgi:TetR/AcrR family transcriptional regulator
MPAGLVLCVAGSLVQFWLHSRVEIQHAIEIGGGKMPDDETFIRHVMKLVAMPSTTGVSTRSRSKAK